MFGMTETVKQRRAYNNGEIILRNGGAGGRQGEAKDRNASGKHNLKCRQL